MFVLDINSFKNAKITIFLIFLNILFFVVFLLNSDTELYLLFVQINYNILQRLEIWRLFTSMFLHGDLIHLISNLFGLVLFGAYIENVVSKVEYLLIYLISGLFGNLMSLIFLPPYIISLGASGAIYGLIGASIMLIILQRNKSLLFIGFMYLLYFIITSFSPGINYYSHIFGLICGLILGFFFIRKKNTIKYDAY